MDSALVDTFAHAATQALTFFPVDAAGQQPVLVAESENVTFKVTDARNGRQYVLRLHRPGYHTLDELESERVWIRALNDSGIGVPVPVAANDGREYVPVEVAATRERRFAGLVRWTEGKVLAGLLEEAPGVGTLQAWFRELGGLIAGLHNQATGWATPETFRRHRLDTAGLMGETPFWGPFWEHPALTPDERSVLLAARDRVCRVLDRYGRDGGIYSLIHADLTPHNVLVDGERLAVIDFDDAGFGWHLYDLAVALVEYQRRADFAAIEQALLDGYRSVRPLPRGTDCLLPVFRMIRGMVVIGWYHERPEIDPTRFVRTKDLAITQCRDFLTSTKS
jgi:Ser/Thr protein kinase RdoA (MazF antagonist)